MANYLGFRFLKFDSNTYVIRYRGGRVVAEGRGLAFWYYSPTTSIAALPMGSRDVQFIFKDTTADFQTVTIQGSCTYTIDAPRKLADLLDFSVDAQGVYKKDDPEKLPQRLINEAQTATSALIRSLSLKDAIRSAKRIEQTIFEGLGASEAIRQLGLAPLSVNILAVRPTPEMEKALEAATREALQQEADEAIYKRRNFAVEKEREVKENELSTEIAVAEKQRQIRETELNTALVVEEKNRQLKEQEYVTQLAVEAKSKELSAAKHERAKQEADQQREIGEGKLEARIVQEERAKALVEIELANARARAEGEAYALRQLLDQYQGLDWKTILALKGGGSAALNLALAFRELAENAQKIGTLNVSPDLLQGLLSDEPVNQVQSNR
ncbi:MAG: SPFH domain-containing protein [Bacteroidia bacterium]|nr:SPFH domain-containing protein [Bacteroidia bacterium]